MDSKSLSSGKTALFTSGGKDSALAWHLTRDLYFIDYFITMVDNGLIPYHDTRPDPRAYLIDVTGLSDSRASWWREVDKVAKAVRDLNVKTIIFGNIDPVPEVVQRYAEAEGVRIISPIQGWDRKRIILAMLDLGIRARIIKVYEGNPDLLGREIDRAFMESDHGIDLCGEKGEYHTQCISGGI